MYEVRKRLRQDKNRIHSERRRFTKIMQIEHAIRNYENAYRDLHGVVPKVSYKHGWYYLNKFVRVRYHEVIERTERMMVALHEIQIGDTDE